MVQTGVVYLVGAGPGDPELLTIAGQRHLAAADCVIYDRLIDPRLLELAPPDAERISVGEHASARQSEARQSAINELLIERARAGRAVVRLKGGDPLLFARGAEEAEALEEAGVRYEIVPGVTAALAAAATASVPLTHRQAASAVAFLTGHEDPSKSTHLDYDGLAKFPGTLVVYMGLTRIGAVAAALIAGGRDPDTPVVMVEWGGSNRQCVAELTLQAATAGAPPQLKSPVVSIIGEVCARRSRFGWFERRPLFGQRVLVTRAPHQAGEMAAKLEALGARVDCQSVFEIEPVDDYGLVDQIIEELDQIDWLVFSSRNGVNHFVRRVLEIGMDLRAFGGVRLAAIGPGTADALFRWHLKADVVPAEYRAEALASSLRDHVAGKRVVLVRADRGREVLAQQLREAGARLETVVVYRQRDVIEPAPDIVEDLRGGRIGWVLFSSSNMFRGFCSWLDDESTEIVRNNVKLVTISPVTSQTVREAGFEVTAEARVYTIDGLIDALLEAVTSTQTRSPGPARRADRTPK